MIELGKPSAEYSMTITLAENEKVIADNKEPAARDERKLRELLVQLQQHARLQSPIFSSSLLTKIERIESLLSEN